MPSPSLHALKTKIESLPRVHLAHLPTPFEKLSNLSKQLESIQLFVKRDDQTGLAFGGNKARKLEFIMADALAAKADTVITWAGVQSNWCRQTAAAAKKLGLEPVLVLFKREGLPYEFDGNLLVDVVFDSDIRLMEKRPDQNIMEFESVKETIEAIAGEVRRKGKHPYIAPIGGSLVEASMLKPWGAIGYVNAFIEILEQASASGISLDAVILATGSGSTQAGLLVGAKLLSPQTRIVGVSVSETKDTMTRYVRSIAEQTLEQLGTPAEIADDEIIVLPDYLAEGYGILTREVTDAVRLVAVSEGLLLDPVYTGKAMTGLLDLTKKDYFEKDANLVFLHSGGTPALFPYREGMLAHLGTV